MLDLDLEELIPNIISYDVNTNGRNTYISQVTILTIKSLLPMEESVGNAIDYKRFTEELKLWKEYSTGENISLLNIFNSDDKSRYLDFNDETYFTRLIPIIIANKDSKIIEEEITKNILYFSGKIENLFEWLLIGLFIYSANKDNEEIIEILKDYIINFAQTEFVDKYQEYYRTSTYSIPSTFKINIERERICLLDILNGKKSTKYLNLQDLLKINHGYKPSTPIGDIVCKSFENPKIDPFYLNMNEYILKLRNGRIPLEDLKIDEYIIPDIFSYEDGEVFFHSLLNYSKIIKKEVKAGSLTSLVSTKSGNYLFKRDP